MTLDCETSFIASNLYDIHVNASITVKVLGGISFHVIAKNWKHLKDTLAFASFLVCSNRNRVLLICDLFPTISLFVRQSSVNISRARSRLLHD